MPITEMIDKNRIVVFKNQWVEEMCYIEEKYYPNGRLALQLVVACGEGAGVPVAKATVNLPDEPLGEKEVFIKDWGENEGMYACLVAAGIVGPILERIPTGHVMAYRVKLLI